MEKVYQPKIKNQLNNLMSMLKSLNEKGTINSLSVQQSGINDRMNFDHVSFKIPKTQF